MRKQAETKIGGICSKHPELNGLQIAKTRWCVACSRERAKAYYEEHKERLRVEHREYARKNIESNSKRAIEWAKENKERHAENARKWRANNPDKASIPSNNWKARNPEWCAETESRKRAIVKQAQPKWANRFFILEAYRLARLRSKMFGYEWQVDHVVPLKSKRVCGLHCESNLQVIPASFNAAKGNRHWPDMHTQP